MDDIEKVYTCLVEMDLPASIADMKNPSSDYMVNLITQFLGKFKIDVSTIRKPTFDQQTLSLVDDNPDILGLVNLSEALASICRNIFLNDFHLTDITSPIPKRSRKIAKLMANYLLYATTKMIVIEARLKEYRLTCQQLHEIRNERMALIDAKNERALSISMKIKANEQIALQIAKLKAAKEVKRQKLNEIEEKLKSAQQEKLETEQRHKDSAARASKTRKKLNEVKSRIVKSPERLEAQLRDLVEQQKEQSKKGETVQETLQKRIPWIKHTQSCQNFVRQAHDKFPEVTHLYNRFAKSKKDMENTLKHLAELKNTVDLESNPTTKECSNAVLQKAKTVCEKNLFAVRKEHGKLSTEKKVLTKKNEDLDIRLQEILSKKNEIRATIVEKEAKSEIYLQECQKICNMTLQKEQETYGALKLLFE